MSSQRLSDLQHACIRTWLLGWLSKQTVSSHFVHTQLQGFLTDCDLGLTFLSLELALLTLDMPISIHVDFPLSVSSFLLMQNTTCHQKVSIVLNDSQAIDPAKSILPQNRNENKTDNAQMHVTLTQHHRCPT